MTGLEEGRDFVLRNTPQSRAGVASQTWREPVVVDTARQVLVRRIVVTLFLETDTARRMTGAAMSERLHQISAAIPLSIAVGTRLERTRWREHKTPEGQRPSLIEWKRYMCGRSRPGDGRNAVHHVRVKRAHVRVRYLGIGRIRHCRIQPLIARGNAVAQHAHKILIAVSANAEALVRRDVGADYRAERRCQPESPRIRCAASRGRVASS